MKLEEIAGLAGVSRTTASYVINGKAKQHRVSDKTIAKVMAVVKEHNFYPNAVAAGLRAGKTYSIGLIIPDLKNINYARIANCLEQLARKEKYQLLISCSQDNAEIEKECISQLKQRRIDALIIIPASASELSSYDNWDNNNIPILALSRPLPADTFRSIVASDQDDAASLVKELVQYPMADIVYLGALPELSIDQLRVAGFQQGDYLQGKKVDYLYANNYSRKDADVAFSQWLTSHPMPNGLFIASFSLLQGTIDAILRKFGRLPKNLSIATFGDNELLDFLPSNIISLVQNRQKIASTAITLLLDYLTHNSIYTPGMTIIERQLINRGNLYVKNKTMLLTA